MINYNYCGERLLPRRPITAREWIIGIHVSCVKNPSFHECIKQRNIAGLKVSYVLYQKRVWTGQLPFCDA